MSVELWMSFCFKCTSKLIGDKTSLNSMIDNLHFSSLHNRKGIHNRFEVSLAFSNVILKLQHYINYQYWTANDLYFSCLQHNVGLGLVMYLRNVTRDFR